jgi:MFS family permease
LSISSRNQSKYDSLFIPILAALNIILVSTLPLSSMAVLFKEISEDLNLNVVQIGAVWGMISFGSIFILPIGGGLCDRLGTKRTIVILGLLSGLIGALRGLSNGFLSLMATTFFWGILSWAIIPALNMVASQYSSSQRQGLAQGLMAAGGGLGLTLGSLISASLLSPLLGGWRPVLILYGGIAIVISLYWQFSVREPEHVKPTDSQKAMPLRQIFIRLLRLKVLWLIGLSMLAYGSCSTGMQGFLPYYLENNGWATVAAGGALAAYTASSTIGVIPMSILSDRIGSRKIPLLVTFLTSIVGIGLMSVFHNWILWVLVILAGTFSSTSAAMFTTICIETKEVGMAYSGTAVSLILAISCIGKAFGPPIGNSLANVSTVISWPFMFWAALAAVSAIILIFIRETGRRSQGKIMPRS